MTIKVSYEYADHTDRLTIAGKGKQCRIDVNIGRYAGAYSDSIDILTHEGHVSITGNHVHELMKSVLRFSSRSMLKEWIRFALLTNKAAGQDDIDLTAGFFAQSAHAIRSEATQRMLETEFNSAYFTYKENEHA